eukprot:TRINITY_DN35584_c0_g1_i1.p1 TRINITY_DN35584_c0_g1~~TRINITY_DN35584_c0_g1_i1.p1  ORF type:complete len:405 (-),score=125.45 TRINITY_DN35584_c0_g1_i1:333-1493(-)
MAVVGDAATSPPAAEEAAAAAAAAAISEQPCRYMNLRLVELRRLCWLRGLLPSEPKQESSKAALLRRLRRQDAVGGQPDLPHQHAPSAGPPEEHRAAEMEFSAAVAAASDAELQRLGCNADAGSGDAGNDSMPTDEEGGFADVKLQAGGVSDVSSVSSSSSSSDSASELQDAQREALQQRMDAGDDDEESSEEEDDDEADERTSGDAKVDASAPAPVVKEEPRGAKRLRVPPLQKKKPSPEVPAAAVPAARQTLGGDNKEEAQGDRLAIKRPRHDEGTLAAGEGGADGSAAPLPAVSSIASVEKGSDLKRRLNAALEAHSSLERLLARREALVAQLRTVQTAAARKNEEAAATDEKLSKLLAEEQRARLKLRIKAQRAVADGKGTG